MHFSSGDAMRLLAILILAVLVSAPSIAEELVYTGDCSNGCASGESFTHTNANEINTAVDDNASDIDALQALDTTGEIQTAEGVNIILETEMDASSELRALIDDETGTGAIVFAGGAIGAATATTPSANDSDTSVATTAYVQGEINGAGGTDLTCSSGSCSVDAAITRDAEWDTVAEIETATSADIVTSTEVSSLTTSASAASGSCTVGDLWLETTTPTLYGCTSTDTWEAL